jgi:hypothetical protein
MTDIFETLTATYEVPETNLHVLFGKLTDLNKRAKRLRVAPITWKVIGQTVREFRDDITAMKVKRVYHTVEISGLAPKLNGWSFVATLDFTSGEGEGVIVRTVPGFTVDAKYRHSNANCDHCAKIRRRNETFIVRNDAGNEMRVGRQCLRDFLGHQDPHLIARLAEFLAEVNDLGRSSEDDDFFGMGGSDNRIYLARYLTFVSATIRAEGWVSGKQAFEQHIDSTAVRAMMHMRNKNPERSDPKPTEQDKEVVEKAIEWIREVRADAMERDVELDDYMHNLSVVCASDMLSPKNKGIAASLITAHRREIEREINRKKVLTLSETSQFVGTVGKRQVFTLTVLGMNTFMGNMGPTTLVRFTDGANAFTWFASGDVTAEVGKTYRVKATVKKHEAYKGRDAKCAPVKTTFINRAVFEGEVAA